MSLDEQTTGAMYEAQVSTVVSEPFVLKRNVLLVEFAHIKIRLLQPFVADEVARVPYSDPVDASRGLSTRGRLRRTRATHQPPLMK